MDFRLELLGTLSLSANGRIWKGMAIIVSFLWHTFLSPCQGLLSHPSFILTVLVLLLLQMWLKAGQQNYWAEGGVSLCKSSVIYWNLCLAYVLPSAVFVGEGFYRLSLEDFYRFLSPVVTYLVHKGTRAVLPLQQSLPILCSVLVNCEAH